MPDNQTPALEVPAVLRIVKIEYQDRDWRYTASFPATKGEPNPARSILEMGALVAFFMVFSAVTFFFARWWWLCGHPGW